MANVQVRLNLPALNRLMAGNTMQAQADRIGRAMAADAGAGFEYRPRRHRWTAGGVVGTADVEGARRQADDAVLERVVSRRR